MAPETRLETYQDLAFGLSFSCIAALTVKRVLKQSRSTSDTESVIATLYNLIFSTALVRAVWFLIPNSLLAVASIAPKSVSCKAAVRAELQAGGFDDHEDSRQSRCAR